MISKYKNTFIASVGVSFEYYDFIVYALMAPYLSELFFDSSSLGMVKYFSLFAVGYIFRPLGGILFGLISDKYGRKRTFLILILLMSTATFIMGMLPVSKSNIVICVLVLCRIMQGIAFGGEFTNAVTFVHENVNKQSPLHNSFVTSSANLGNIFALVVLYLLTTNLSNAQFMSWGWRVPFLLSGVLGLLCYRFRVTMDESVEYARHQNVLKKVGFGKPILEIFRTHLRQVLIGFVFSVLISSLVIVSLYLPTYLSTFYAYSKSDIYNAMTISLVWSLVIAPIFGLYVIRFRKTSSMLCFVLVFLAVIYFNFQMLSQGSWIVLVGFLLVFQTFTTALYVVVVPMLAELFPVRVRNTGIAFCYNIGYAVSSLIPMAVSAVNERNAWGSETLLWVVTSILVASLFVLISNIKFLNNVKQINS